MRGRDLSPGRDRGVTLGQTLRLVLRVGRWAFPSVSVGAGRAPSRERAGGRWAATLGLRQRLCARVAAARGPVPRPRDRGRELAGGSGPRHADRRDECLDLGGPRVAPFAFVQHHGAVGVLKRIRSTPLSVRQTRPEGLGRGARLISKRLADGLSLPCSELVYFGQPALQKPFLPWFGLQ